MEECKHGLTPKTCLDCKDAIIQTISDAHVASAQLSIQRALELKSIRQALREFQKRGEETVFTLALRATEAIRALREEVTKLEAERDAAIKSAQRWTRRALAATPSP